MIDENEALRTLASRVPVGLSVRRSGENELFWTFIAKEETRADRAAEILAKVSARCFVVHKADGHVSRLGSPDRPDAYRVAVEHGFRHSVYDLHVDATADLPGTLTALLRFNLQYCVPEVEAGEIWRRSRPWTTSMLERLIGMGPATFPSAFTWRDWRRVPELLAVAQARWTPVDESLGARELMARPTCRRTR